MKYLLIFTLALSCTGLAAQVRTTNDTPTAQEGNRACNVPDMVAVKGLNLTDAQLIKIREVHAEIERECLAARDRKGTVDAEIMLVHQQRIKEALTEEQYAEYVALGTSERKVQGTREVKGEGRKVH